MPYITEDRRVELDKYITNLDRKLAEMEDVGGDLNYVISRLLFKQYERYPRYSTIERLVGCLVCCKDEFQRRITAKHEDEALRRNGDVYSGR